MSFIKQIQSHNKPVIMGILNVTPDSFSDGGKFNKVDQAVKQAQLMQQQGAQIIDIGGESTRPGAKKVPLAQELERILPIIEKLKQETDIKISVDTSKAKVMQEVIKLNVALINDVCALQEKGALETVANSNVDVCLMHKKGTPISMQKAPQYENIVAEIIDFFKQRIDACEKQGVDKNRLILDPGFGFGKSVDHNFEVLKRFKSFTQLGLPLLSGTSRKSMIGTLCNAAVNQRLAGSLATAILAVQNKAKIVRVHDVYETNQALQIILKIQRS